MYKYVWYVLHVRIYFSYISKNKPGYRYDLFGMRVIQVMYRYMCVYTDFTMII
jgi:hypothetical protein